MIDFFLPQVRPALQSAASDGNDEIVRQIDHELRMDHVLQLNDMKTRLGGGGSSSSSSSSSSCLTMQNDTIEGNLIRPNSDRFKIVYVDDVSVDEDNMSDGCCVISLRRTCSNLSDICYRRRNRRQDELALPVTPTIS